MQLELAHKLVLLDTVLVSLWLHTEEAPPEEQWESAVSEIGAARQKLGLSATQLRLLVLTDGAAPSRAQSAGLQKRLFDQKKVLSSVVTPVLSNPLKRGVATALSWMNPAMAFFSPDEFGAAVAHLGLGPQRRALWSELMLLATKLPRCETVRRLSLDVPRLSLPRA
jgi:hypothetical protein